jgi:hypothetical protein
MSVVPLRSIQFKTSQEYNKVFLSSRSESLLPSFETPSLPTLRHRYPRDFTLITRTPVLTPATLAAFPSTHSIPDRDVFYVARPTRSIPFVKNRKSLAATFSGSRVRQRISKRRNSGISES